VNGFSDWFLPSRGELDLMYANLARKGLGGFKTVNDETNFTNLYWSSSMIDIKYSFSLFQDFDGGRHGYLTGSGTFGFEAISVRAIRAF